MFDNAMRGYDRAQVDQRIQDLTAQLLVALERAETAERELAEAVDSGRAGFGNRIQKMLGIAEHEADELREEARREASEILEHARLQAEAREHELDKTLAARQAELNERAEELTRDLQAQRAAMTEELAAAREEAEGVRGGAAANAAAVLDKAQEQARATLLAAEKAAEEHHDWIRDEIERLLSSRDGLRAELSRLHEHRADIPTENQDAPVDNVDARAAVETTPEAATESPPEIVRPRRPEDSPQSSDSPRRSARN